MNNDRSRGKPPGVMALAGFDRATLYAHRFVRSVDNGGAEDARREMTTMLDAYIIDAIWREEEARRQEDDRPRLYLPLHPDQPTEERSMPETEDLEADRGVLHIPLH